MRYALILSFVALPAFGQDAGSSDTEAEPPVGGVGRLACSAIVGPENAAYLGQVGDWALGYMAGRLDAGDELAEGETLSPDDTVDVVAGVAVRCRESPDQPVIEAVRDFAERVFGTEAQAGPIVADAPPPPPDAPENAASAEPPRESVAPEPRPSTAPSGTEPANAGSSSTAPSRTGPAGASTARPTSPGAEPSDAEESSPSTGSNSSTTSSPSTSSARTPSASIASPGTNRDSAEQDAQTGNGD